MKRIALVSGGNRGIGREICRQLTLEEHIVLLGSRDLDQGEAAAAELRRETGGDVRAYRLDVTDAEVIQRLRDDTEAAFGRLDVLVNNAGIFLERGKSLADVDVEAMRRTMDVNVYGPLRLTQALLPLMRRNNWGRIVNVSSAMGALSSVGDGSPNYRLSKVNLNLITRVLAQELAGSGIKVNAISPGWVRTDMGGASAPRTAAEGADTAVWLATIPDDGPSGGFFHDRQPIPW